MKTGIRPLLVSSLFLLGVVPFLVGCATTGMDRSIKTSHSIQEVDKEIRGISTQIDMTAASLDALVKPGQTELKEPFERYSKDVDKLDGQGESLLKRVEEMKSLSTEYFTEWEKDGNAYTNPQVRELSEERRLKLAELYARVPASGAGVKVSYLAYLTDLKEIQKYLSNDLTPRGIQAIDPVARQTVGHLGELKESLEPVITALDGINAEMYSGKK
jgi:hypothetical protein